MTARVREVHGRLSAPFANARVGWEERRAALLTLEGEGGAWGQGEWAPLPGFSADQGGVDELFDIKTLNIELGAPLFELPTLSPACTAALECAALDLAGRVRGMGVAEQLGGGRSHRVSALVSAGPGPEAVAAAQALLAEGYGAVKWKAGRPGRWDDELATVRAMRAALPEARIRLDLNQGWTFDEAARRLNALEPLHLELVEEPCAPPFPETPVPLGLDEGLLLPDGLERAGASVRALVLKPMALGGVRATHRWAMEARARGLGVVVSHLLEGPVGLAFACEIAAVLPGEVWACGLAPHTGLSVWPEVEISQLQGGVLEPAGPGLGLPRLDGLLERA